MFVKQWQRQWNKQFTFSDWTRIYRLKNDCFAARVRGCEQEAWKQFARTSQWAWLTQEGVEVGGARRAHGEPWGGERRWWEGKASRSLTWMNHVRERRLCSPGLLLPLVTPPGSPADRHLASEGRSLSEELVVDLRAVFLAGSGGVGGLCLGRLLTSPSLWFCALLFSLKRA